MSAYFQMADVKIRVQLQAPLPARRAYRPEGRAYSPEGGAGFDPHRKGDMAEYIYQQCSDLTNGRADYL